MPKPEVAVSQQVADLLQETGVSQRELARRLAAAEKPTGDDFQRRWKSKLRWIPKVLNGEVERPEPASLRAIERALKKPAGTIRLPDRLPREARVAREESIERRLEALEARDVRSGEAILKLRQDLAAAVRRIHALEQRSPAKSQPASKKRTAR